MNNSATPAIKTAGMTDTTDTEHDDSCGCSPLMPCFEHYLNERGRPAIRRIAR